MQDYFGEPHSLSFYEEMNDCFDKFDDDELKESQHHAWEMFYNYW